MKFRSPRASIHGSEVLYIMEKGAWWIKMIWRYFTQFNIVLAIIRSDKLILFIPQFKLMEYKKCIREEMRIGNRVFFNEFEINVFLVKIKMEILFIKNQRVSA